MKSKLLGFVALIFLWGGVTLAAILPAGSLDSSFGPDKNGMIRTTIQDTTLVANTALLQSNGKIIVAGYSQAYGEDKDFLLMRYDPNGTGGDIFAIADISRLVGNPDKDDEINAIALQGEKIIAAGYVTEGTSKRAVLIRLNSDGKLDETFGNQGIKTKRSSKGIIR